MEPSVLIDSSQAIITTDLNVQGLVCVRLANQKAKPVGTISRVGPLRRGGAVTYRRLHVLPGRAV